MVTSIHLSFFFTKAGCIGNKIQNYSRIVVKHQDKNLTISFRKILFQAIELEHMLRLESKALNQYKSKLVSEELLPQILFRE